MIVRSFGVCTRDIAIATNYAAKSTKLPDSTFFRHIRVPKRIAGSQLQFRVLNSNDPFTLHRKLMNVGTVTPEFTTLKCIHSTVVDHYWG